MIKMMKKMKQEKKRRRKKRWRNKERSHSLWKRGDKEET